MTEDKRKYNHAPLKGKSKRSCPFTLYLTPDTNAWLRKKPRGWLTNLMENCAAGKIILVWGDAQVEKGIPTKEEAE